MYRKLAIFGDKSVKAEISTSLRVKIGSAMKKSTVIDSAGWRLSV